MLLRTVDKYEAAEAWIKMWLKDRTKKCFNCNERFDIQSFVETEGCCPEPIIGDNAMMLKMHKKQIDEQRYRSQNIYSSNKDNTMRYEISIPVDLYMFLDKMFKKHYDEKLFETQEEKVRFMKRFKNYFTVPEVI